MNKKKGKMIQTNLLKQKFYDYYQNSWKTYFPGYFDKREFAYLFFEENNMIRHRSYNTEEEMEKYIRATGPAHVYYSTAYYERPNETMDKKVWFGTDLTFDLDSDHIKTPCGSKHPYWICVRCKTFCGENNPTVCPNCSGDKFQVEAYLCEICLEAVKVETNKLLEFLILDFGFKENNLEIFFSGHRGYHVHVKDEEIRSLDHLSRKEIVDYILGTGYKSEFHEMPKLGDPGWRGRIARGIYDLISYSSKEVENIRGINKKALKKFRERYLEARGNITPLSIKGLGVKSWERIIKIAIQRQAAYIDSVVTTDIHRLIRLPMTLHGKTGLLKMSTKINELESFDPLKDAVAFKEGNINVYVNQARKFRIGNEYYGPFKEETINLPSSAAIFLLCKKLAIPVQSI
jgi:DNA primase small subunit